MNKLKIFLADLTHVNSCVVSENIPLNIGLLKSYSEELLGDKVDISLFKYPEYLIKALQEDIPDILGCSNYIWNSRLAEWACTVAKELDSKILTVKGGWNFPLDNEERLNFLKNSPNTDIYCVNESEKSFANILQIYLESGKDALFAKPLPGCVYIEKTKGKSKLVCGNGIERIKELEKIPSPYTNGILEEFFDGKLTPIIEATRGCPFNCNYCNSAVKDYSVVAKFPDEYVINELEYLGQKVNEKGAGPLIIADTNFGMYRRDQLIVEKINELREKYSWPNSILITTGKRNISGVLNAIKSLREILVPSMSVQSMNKDTLDEIKRTNLSMDAYREYANYAEKEGITIYAELILSLPKETLESYWRGLLELLESGARKVITYTLQMNYGTVYRVKEYLNEHQYIGKYRLIPNAFGIYGGNKIFDMEKVAISNKYLSFEDYLECRRSAFLVELAYNNYCFSELIKYFQEKGFSIGDYLNCIRQNFQEAPGSLTSVMEEFIEETENELFETEEELIEFYSAAKNFEKLNNGEIGRNVIYSHKGTMYSTHSEDLITYIINSVQKFLLESNSFDKDDKLILEDIGKYLKVKFHSFLNDENTNDIVLLECSYDIKSWYESDGNKLSKFRNETKYRFLFSDKQKIQINEMFDMYGKSKAGKNKIIAKTMLLQNLLRQAYKY